MWYVEQLLQYSQTHICTAGKMQRNRIEVSCFCYSFQPTYIMPTQLWKKALMNFYLPPSERVINGESTE